MISEGRRPEVVFTLGDPNGIGPEVLVKALIRPEISAAIRPVIFGSRNYLRGLLEDLKLGSLPDYWEIRGSLEVLYPPAWGQVGGDAGRATLGWLEEAVDYCLAQHSQLLVTAPIHKQSVQQAGFAYPGHTEYLSHRFGSARTAMAFFSEQLVVALVTIHIPLRKVPATLNSNRIFETASLLRKALQAAGRSSPRLALCGLNPHASEAGLFGTEEAEILDPAVECFNRHFGGGLEGPFAPDTIFHRAVKGEFDGVVALYHDQGLIPIKLLSFDSSTNATLGLPLVRTSPDHGTAFDIAGQNRANPGSMVASIKWGVRLAAKIPGQA